MSSNFLTEDLLWKLGISTLFILTHRMLLKRNGALKDEEIEQMPLSEKKSSSAKKTFIPISNNINDLTDEETLSTNDLSSFLRSPTDALQNIMDHTALQLQQQKISSASPSTASSLSSNDPHFMYKEILKQNRPMHENEYIESAFQQTIKLFYEENKQLKRKLEEMNKQVEIKDSIIQNLQSSSTISLDTLSEENEKLKQDKQLLIQSIELAQHQFQQIIENPLNTIPNLQENMITTSSDDKKFDSLAFLMQIEQILSEIQLSSLHADDSTPSANLFQEEEDDEEQNDEIPVDSSAKKSMNHKQSLHKLLFIKEFINQNYSKLSQSYHALLKEKESLLQSNQELKQQLNSFKLLKVQEITELHRKYVELQYRYEQQQQHQQYGLNVTPNQKSFENSSEFEVLSNPLRRSSSGGVGSPMPIEKNLPRSRSNSRTTTPKNGGTGTKSNLRHDHHHALSFSAGSTTNNGSLVTPNKEFINLPLAITNIGNSENKKIITKELVKTFQSTSPSSTSPAGSRTNTPNKIRKQAQPLMHMNTSPNPLMNQKRLSNSFRASSLQASSSSSYSQMSPDVTHQAGGVLPLNSSSSGSVLSSDFRSIPNTQKTSSPFANQN